MATPPGPDPGNFTLPDALPVLPIRDAVVFPLTALPLAVGQARSIQLVDDVMRGNRLLALVTQRDPSQRRWPTSIRSAPSASSTSSPALPTGACG
jgi:Lon protease-like protein